ncbi:TPA: hypothetical protein ACTW8K_002454 [Klebsiella quasipneumoniae subsp. similipneumoniae]
MTKSTITREQLEEWVAQFDEDGGCDATDRQLEALIRQSLAAMDSEADCKERKLFCSTDTARMRKVISVSAGTEGAPLYRHAQPVVDIEPVAEVLSNRPGNDTSTIDRALPVGTQLYRHAQPVADSEPDRNPVLAYADSYRDMAKQGVESVPIWSVITDLERNIAPLYRHVQPAPVVPEEKPIPNTLSMYAVDAVAAIAEVKGWNACRAAMLERQLVDRVDEKSLTSINPAPDLVSLQKKAESIIGNYTGIPDGYVMVPVEPNGDMLAAAQDAYGETDGDIASTLRAAMLSGGKP